MFFSVTGVLAACGGASVLECQAQALRILPANVDDIDVGVARELGRRIHTCEQSGAEQSADAGR